MAASHPIMPQPQPKVALITGITGRGGVYLAEFLPEKGYAVHGIKRRNPLFNTERIDHLYQDPHGPGRRFVLHYGGLPDGSSLRASYTPPSPTRSATPARKATWRSPSSSPNTPPTSMAWER
jgi:hypothetical protein